MKDSLKPEKPSGGKSDHPKDRLADARLSRLGLWIGTATCLWISSGTVGMNSVGKNAAGKDAVVE